MAIDTDDTKNSLFGGLSKSEKKTSHVKHEKQVVEHPREEKTSEEVEQPQGISSTAKYTTFDKVTALLTTEQKESLDRIAQTDDETAT